MSITIIKILNKFYTMQLSLEEFVAKLKQQPTPLKIRRLCQKQRELIVQKHYNLFSLKNAFTKYRNCLKTDIGVEQYVKQQSVLNLALEILRLSPNEQKQFNEHKNLQIKRDLSQLRPIHDVEGYLAKAVKFVNSNDIFEIAIGLCALTGRRVGEIFSTCEFTEVCEFSVLFDGQLKTKNSRELIPYEIPVLHNSKVIVKALKYLRNFNPEFKVQSLASVHDKVSWKINKVYKAHFTNYYEPPTRPKDMRSIYATICYAKNPANVRVSRQVFYGHILGHGKDDIQTASSYEDFYLV